MKKVVLIAALAIFSALGAKAQTKSDITFDTEVHDYGTIDVGADGTYDFRFKNTGKEPLIITNAQGSCGCTVPQWPKEPIRPGERGVIKVSYDTKRIGGFSKSVTVSTNSATTPTKVLNIKGTVKEKPAAETFPAKKMGEGSPMEKAN